MKIIDILNKKNMSLSFEVFPPKKESSFESVLETTEKIAAYHPAFMSVTYGAGGGTSRFTLDIAKDLTDKYDVPTLAHLTCVSSSRETVKKQIEEMIFTIWDKQTFLKQIIENITIKDEIKEETENE